MYSRESAAVEPTHQGYIPPTALYNTLAGLGSGAMIPLSLHNRHTYGATSYAPGRTLLRCWLLDAVPMLGTKDIPTTMMRAAIAGLCGLVIDLILIVVSEFFAGLNIP